MIHPGNPGSIVMAKMTPDPEERRPPGALTQRRMNYNHRATMIPLVVRRFSSLLAALTLLVSGLNARGQISGSILQTNGVDIVDGSGNIIRLRGVNLGGWMVMEPWMTPADSSGLPDEYSIISTLDSRFGVPTEQSLIQTYRQSWITTQDLDNIQAQGLNVVRVPVWWGDFYTLSDTTTMRSDAFALLDWLVTSASSRGIYTIIDMHGVFGGQSSSDDTGRENQNLYWTSTNDQMLTAQMWSAIATHYKGNAGVAGYDLINEPSPPSTSGTSPVWIAYNSLYQTVRAADPNHIIFLEGTWGNWDWSMLPSPATYGWTNVVYEMHEYQYSGTDSQMIEAGGDNQVSDFYNHLSWNVPAYIGEFNAFGFGTATWRYEVNDFSNNDMNWSSWSYKATHGPPPDSWGLYDPTGSAGSWPAIPNIQTSSSNAITADWSQWTTANAFSINTMISPVIMASPSSLPPPWSDTDIGSVGLSGSASPVGSGTFTVIGSGTDIANDYDGFHYAYIPWNGDGILVARVLSQTDTGGWAKAGVMFRQSLVAGSVESLTAITPANGCTFQYRSSTNGATTNNGTTSGFAAPRWVKLVRSGTSYTGYEAPNTLPLAWTQEGTAVSLSLSGSSCAGLAVSAENNSALSTAQFDSVVFLCTPVAWGGNRESLLSWAGSCAANYVIQRSTVSGTDYIPVATVTGTTSYLDSGLTNGTTYYYIVTGSTALGNIVNSVQTSVTPGSFLPPSGLTTTVGINQITLNWTAASGAVSYIIERSQTAGGTYTAVGAVTGATSFTDTTVAGGTTYYYVVQSVDSVGLESANSTQRSATPEAPPVTAAELDTSSYLNISGASGWFLLQSSVPGHTYQMQYTNALTSGTWTNYGSTQAGSGGNLQFAIPYNPTVPSGFFRLLIQQ
jgi:aryl-phospho-beta-D-glucosidase BglC (GH1 family)